MSYKYSKGHQIIGDLSGSDDANRDTGIDFEEDYIGFETSGSTVMVVSGSKVGIGTSTPDYELDVAGNIGIDQFIYHNGDADTLMKFDDNTIILKAGGKSFIKAEKKGSAPHEVTINDGGNNIDFSVRGNGSNQGNPGMFFDASTNRVGINGVGSPSWELDVAGDIGLAEYIYHRTDTDTYIRFEDDEISLAAGGRTFINLQEGASDLLVINNGGLDIDFKVSGENQGNLIRTDAANDRVGIGIASPDCELHVDGDIKATGNVNAKLRHINTAKFSSTDASQRYVRWDAAGSNGSPGVNNKFIAPCDGSLVSVTIRCTSAGNGTNIAFHKASSGTANLNTTATETIGVDIASDNTAYQATFSSSTFSAGDILGISIDPSSTPNDVNITCVWLFDWNS